MACGTGRLEHRSTVADEVGKSRGLSNQKDAMTANEFRKMALSLPETTEASHMNHPDFRVSGKIFASLGYPNRSWGMVKLTPRQQALFVDADPEAFRPVKGAWGRRGGTSVYLRLVTREKLRRALEAAWANTASKRLASRIQGQVDY